MSSNVRSLKICQFLNWRIYVKKLILFFITVFLELQIMSSVYAQGLQAEQNSRFVSSDEIYQMRIYEIFDKNKDAFHARFRDHAVRIMKRYEFQIIAMWEAEFEERTEFVYILRWPDEATMKRQWHQFMSDPEWDRIKRETAQEHGNMVGGIEDRVMMLTSYSNSIR
ncbi:TPA: NIPSNAP family protein [Citrobacter freundii]|uniref:NIPSNAP family protein n=1 Tax=Gammaproteobacteria TaxID=1236 RepID=UPI00191190EF|nr:MULTISPECIES: NIPSNAP family protein [Gammaproteobacteria]MBN5418833.1 NIPSNAP family protein [Serratia marcescens]HBV8384414.1 NIPSNAP family protein [Citrobacter freundii]HDY6068310.1 NIPSNAP family protein [Pseudomonas aeruginosa]